jgi:phage terminase large subunit-like protein
MNDLLTAAEVATMLRSRSQSDGLAVQSLFKHQAQFVESTKDEAWCFGANRSGKTEALATVGATFGRFGVLDPALAYSPSFQFKQPVRIWAVSLTYDMSRNILQAKMFDNGARIDPRPALIPSDEIENWNITNQTLRLKNGSIIIFKSCDGGRDSFQGADVDLVLFDEVPDKDVYNEVMLRIGGGRRLMIRGAATILPPAGVPGGVSWMYLAKALPWLKLGASNDERNAKSERLDIFTAGIRDNPTILAHEIERLCTVFAPDSPEYMIRVEGMLLPSIGGSLCYVPFNHGYHVVETLMQSTGEGMVKPVVHPFLPLCLNVDFNPENGVWTIGQRIGKVFRVLDEITMERSDIAAMTYEFRTRYPGHQAELWIYGDATGRRREGQTSLSSFHLISQYLQGYPCPIRFRLPDINPPQKDRVNAVNAHLRPPTGERLVEFSPLCVETIKDAEGTKWDNRMKIDKKHGRRSDGMDTVGYWIHYEAPVHTAFAPAPTVRSIRRPEYMRPEGTGPFPSTGRTNRIVRIGNRYYTRRFHA